MRKPRHQTRALINPASIRANSMKLFQTVGFICPRVLLLLLFHFLLLLFICPCALVPAWQVVFKWRLRVCNYCWTPDEIRRRRGLLLVVIAFAINDNEKWQLMGASANIDVGRISHGTFDRQTSSTVISISFDFAQSLLISKWFRYKIRAS